MGEKRIIKKMLHTKMEGKRPTGRPKTRWIDKIRKDIEMRGENWEEIEEKRTKNRDGWRFLCYSQPIYLETT